MNATEMNERERIDNPIHSGAVSINVPEEVMKPPLFAGNLNLTGSDAFRGFLKDCINVVWDPDGVQTRDVASIPQSPAAYFN